MKIVFLTLRPGQSGLLKVNVTSVFNSNYQYLKLKGVSSKKMYYGKYGKT